MNELELSADQAAALDGIVDWFKEVRGQVWACESEACCKYPHVHSDALEQPPVMSLGGLAGTGKTTIIRLLEERLECKIQFGTPTHKAARVLRSKLSDEQAGRVATYHSLIYRMNALYRCTKTGKFIKPYKDGCDHGSSAECDCALIFPSCSPENEGHSCSVQESLSKEMKKFLAGDGELLVIDEASMLGEDEVNDVRRFNVPVLLVGDHGQLPPVKSPMNQWIASPATTLTENHRQGEASGIVGAALSVRQRGRLGLPYGTYGDGSMIVVFKDDPGASNFVNPTWWKSKKMEPPPFICYLNKTRGSLNRLFHGEGPVRAGDKITALERCLAVEVVNMNDGHAELGDRQINVHNGDTGTVVRVLDGYRPGCVDVAVRLDDRDGDEIVLFTNVLEKQFGMDTKISWNQRPGGVTLLDYAYAFTCHKAQGSEWDGVIVIDENPRDYHRWMYTALTRAKNRLVVVRTR